MLDADTVINNSSQKVGGSNAYPDPAPKKVGGSGYRKTHRIYTPAIQEKPQTKLSSSLIHQMTHKWGGATPLG